MEVPKKHEASEADGHTEHLLHLSKSPEGLPAVEIQDSSPSVQSTIRRMLSASQLDDPDYQERTKVGAFLQGDSDGWMLVEFWKGSPSEHQAFVDYLNNRIQEQDK